MMKYVYLLILLTSNLFAAPDFLIIGVTKGGTTSLYDFLVQHPKILGAKKKELYFFIHDEKFNKGLSYYNSLFPTKKHKDDLLGEATPLYFQNQECPQRVAALCPKAKLILILRNPAKRAVSHYFFFNSPSFSKKWQGLSFEAAIDKSKGWKNEIINQGYYFEHLIRWLKCFPKEQMHIVILEDLVVSPELEVNKVFNFLGLGNFKLDSYAPENKGSYSNGSITPESIKMLEQVYEPHNKKLEEFLGRTLPWGSKITKSILDDELFV